MLTKKKQISKKEIKEDKLVTTYYQAVQYLDENRSRLYVYVGIFVALVALVYFYIDHRAKNNEKANTELARVMDIYNQGAYQEAIDGRKGTNITGLKKIVDEYGSSENGETAKIFLANCYNFLGKFDEAFKYYDDYSGGIDELKATALAGKAGCYEAQKEYQKAAEAYKDAAHVSKTDVQNGEYLLNSGINYLKAGMKEKALEQFTTIRDDYNTSSAMRELDRYMAQAK
ncbi:MAG: tetratricopeptide repeat protein [Bacteroidota bacterium]|nr:tetratricopeptide repeat protein [Bacteroidota bacterium]MDP4191627.1 tetratricopeptide repeat protein [Bacteroidota bacterium]MDP4196351.1 tetratricopeptide repeat protein [Bacteroidota bacterium]